MFVSGDQRLKMSVAESLGACCLSVVWRLSVSQMGGSTANLYTLFMYMYIAQFCDPFSCEAVRRNLIISVKCEFSLAMQRIFL